MKISIKYFILTIIVCLFFGYLAGGFVARFQMVKSIQKQINDRINDWEEEDVKKDTSIYRQI